METDPIFEMLCDIEYKTLLKFETVCNPFKIGINLYIGLEVVTEMTVGYDVAKACLIPVVYVVYESMSPLL
jgi:hypothetical protein